MSEFKKNVLSYSVKDILGLDKKLNLLYKNPLNNAESLILKKQFKSAIEIYSRVLIKITDKEIVEKISKNVDDLREIIKRENPELEKSIPQNLKPKSIEAPLKELSESLGGSLTEKLNILKQIETVPEKEVTRNFPYSKENLKPENIPTKFKDDFIRTDFNPVEISIEAESLNVTEKNSQLSQNTKSDNFQSKNIESDNFQSKNIESDNFQSKNIESENTQSKNIESDNFQSKNTQSKNIESKNTQSKNTQSKNIESKNIESDNIEPEAYNPAKKFGEEISPFDLDKNLDSLLEDSFSLKKKDEIESVNDDFKPKQTIEESDFYFSEKADLDKIELVEEEIIRKKRVKSKKDFKDFEGFLQDSETDTYFDQILNPTKKTSSVFEEEFLDINPQKRKKGKGNSLVDTIVSNSELEEEILKEFGSFIKSKNNPEKNPVSEIQNEIPTKNKILEEDKIEFASTSFEATSRPEPKSNKATEIENLKKEFEEIKKIDKFIESDDSIQKIYLKEETKPVEFVSENNSNPDTNFKNKEEEIFVSPRIPEKQVDINDKLSNLYFSEEFQNFKSLPFKDRRSGKDRRVKKVEFKNEKRSGIERRISIPDKLKKRAEFLKKWEENYLNEFAKLSQIPDSIIDTPAFPYNFKEIEFLPSEPPSFKPKEVPTSKLEKLDFPEAKDKIEPKQKQEDFPNSVPNEFPKFKESIPANKELVFKDDIDLVKINLPEPSSLNISGEKTAESKPKSDTTKKAKDDEIPEQNLGSKNFSDENEIELIIVDLPEPKDYVRSKSGHLVDPFEEKEAPEIVIGDTEFPDDLPASEEELPEISGLPEIQEEPKEPEKIIHGVLELKPPEVDDAPFLTLTYDFSKIPHSYKLSKNYNIMEYSYYKYKPMLMKAQEFARRKMLKNALNYYRVIKSQNIPPELKKMISRNIIDITEFLEKFTMSKGG